MQALLGSLPDGFCAYFESRFPRLLLFGYNFMCIYCVQARLSFIRCLRMLAQPNNLATRCRP